MKFRIRPLAVLRWHRKDVMVLFCVLTAVQLHLISNAAAAINSPKDCSDFVFSQILFPPGNNNCISAETLTIKIPGGCEENETVGTTIDATSTNSAFSCHTGDADVYYTFNAGTFSNVIINLNPISASDVSLNVLEGNCVGTSLSCDFNSIELATEPNTTYLIRVSSEAGGQGTFSLCVEGIYECPALAANIGDPCNDGNPNTLGDVVIADCGCVGTEPAGPLNGTVIWSSNCGTRNATVDIFTPGTDVLIAAIETTVDAFGDFSVSGFPSGTYDIFMKIDGYLTKGFSDVIFTSTGATLTGVVVKTGDIDNDDSVNGNDFALLAVSYFTLEGDNLYNAGADLDCNGEISGIDFALISANYFSIGDNPPLDD